MSISNTLLTALRGVFANKLRAALTMLGVIIGVASVITMLALGNGARAAVENNFRFLGSDEVQISAMMKFDDEGLVNAGKSLSYEDGLRMPENVPLVDSVDMVVGASTKVRFGHQTLDMSVSGVTVSALEKMATSSRAQPVGWPEGQALDAQAFLGSGRFFTPVEVLEGAEVCVLAATADLFGYDSLGQAVWVNRKRCGVIGVLKNGRRRWISALF
jgi:ABC-type lipoprotein release transport system permease subunit